MSLDKIPNYLKVWLRIKRFFINILVKYTPFFKFIRDTSDYKHPITFNVWYSQKIKSENKYCYWPVHPTTCVTGAKNVFLGVETFPGYMPGCYIQAIGPIYIGDHSIFSANVGIISSNHSLYDGRNHVVGEVRIGRYCWIGMNAVILPGVELGDFIVVGAGAVVTQSFEKGYCVIAGNPARVIRELSIDECIEYDVKHPYYGYLTADEYRDYRKE